MKQGTHEAARPSVGTIIAALVAGVVVLLLMFPASGVSTYPPVCYSMLFYPVPCDAWVALLAAAATAGLVGWGLWRYDRRRR
jgi:hypothetical protein